MYVGFYTEGGEGEDCENLNTYIFYSGILSPLYLEILVWGRS